MSEDNKSGSGNEIEEENETTPLVKPLQVPLVEISLYRQGKGPVETFKSNLGGYEQNQLEVQDILDKYGFKSIYAFNPQSGRGVPIRFNHRNGRSLLPYRDGAEIFIDGEPKDSLLKPVTKILLGVAVMTVLITVAMTGMKDPPNFVKKFNFYEGNFPPWILALVVIVFTRMRKRTRDFVKKLGW